MLDNKNIDTNKVDCKFPIIDIDGIISGGKQFDLDITLPEDKRDVIFGKIKNVFKEPIQNAIIKLIEIDSTREGRKSRVPISHTFTNEHGEFVFGPLCPGKKYAIDIWVNDVRHYKIDVKCHHEGECLRNISTESIETNKN